MILNSENTRSHFTCVQGGVIFTLYTTSIFEKELMCRLYLCRICSTQGKHLLQELLTWQGNSSILFTSLEEFSHWIARCTMPSNCSEKDESSSHNFPSASTETDCNLSSRIPSRHNWKICGSRKAMSPKRKPFSSKRRLAVTAAVSRMALKTLLGNTYWDIATIHQLPLLKISFLSSDSSGR